MIWTRAPSSESLWHSASSSSSSSSEQGCISGGRGKRFSAKMMRASASPRYVYRLNGFGRRKLNDLSQAIGVLQAGLTLSAVARGLGSKRIEDSSDGTRSLTRVSLVQELWGWNETDSHQVIYSTDILFATANLADKCAVVLFLRRLSSARTSFRACNALLAACALYFVGSVLLLCLQTPLGTPWIGVMQMSRVSTQVAKAFVILLTNFSCPGGSLSKS